MHACDTPYEELVVSIEEVTHAIEKLDLNKPCGSDGICSEHLKCYYRPSSSVPLYNLTIIELATWLAVCVEISS